MKETILHILHYTEYFIPGIFFLFTHYADEKIHMQVNYATHHPDRLLHSINKYQWELCFLVISLVCISGINIAHRHGKHFFMGGLIVFGIGLILLFLMFVLVVKILNTKKPRMNPQAFYASIFIFFSYMATDIYFSENKNDDFFVIGKFVFKRWYIYPLFIMLSLVILFLIKRIIDRKRIIIPDPTGGIDVAKNIDIFNNQKATVSIKKEALFYIIKYYHSAGLQQKLLNWIDLGYKQFPERTVYILKRLNISHELNPDVTV